MVTTGAANQLERTLLPLWRLHGGPEENDVAFGAGAFDAFVRELDDEFGFDARGVTRDSTLAECATAVRVAFHAQRRNGAVILGTGDATPAFAFIHPLAGAALAFAPLSRHLPGRLLVGLEAPGLHGERAPESTIEGTARVHAETLQAVVGDAPIVLAGLGTGGTIALEVAALLGPERVAVMLLDTDGPEIAFDASDEVVETIGKMSGIEAGLVVTRAGAEAFRAHRFEPRDFPHVVLLRAVEGSPKSAVEQGWKTVVPRLEEIPVAGTALTMMTPPQVAEVASRLIRLGDALR